jgi:hypothetical protein
MIGSYGVVWRDGPGPLATGKLELAARRLSLDGLAGARPVLRELEYESLAGVRVGRAPDDRIEGHPTVVLEHGSGTIALAPVARPSLVSEIVERVTGLKLAARASKRTTVVVPLVPGADAAARALLEAGPPLDPERVPGLIRHEVFLTPDEAVFLFETRPDAEILERLLEQNELWQAVAAWRDHLAGPPRLAENVYAWRRTDGAAERPLLPPGLRD